MSSHILYSITISTEMLDLGVQAAAVDPYRVVCRGRILDSEGDPVDGIFDVTVSIYYEKSGGYALWTESQSITVTQGLFKTFLGSKTLFTQSALGPGGRWLGFAVGSDPELPDRHRLTTTDPLTGKAIFNKCLPPDASTMINPVDSEF